MTVIDNLEHSTPPRESEYRTLVEHSPICIHELDLDGRFISMNPAGLTMLGKEREEQICGSPFDLVVSKPDQKRIRPYFERALQGEICHFHFLSSGSEVRHLKSSFIPLKDEQGVITRIMGLTEDITQLKKNEEAQNKYLRTISLLRQCDVLLVRETNERNLLTRICQLAVETGGYSMAWVGYAEDDASQSVRCIASFGPGEAYLKQANITWNDSPRGQGSVGTAIRSGKTTVVQDMLASPSMRSWHTAAWEHGYLSCISLPLHLDTHVLGTLTLYAGETNAFSSDEIELLAELANDLAYGIKTLRTRQEKDELIVALRHESEKNWAYLHNASDGIHILDVHGNILEASNSFCAMLGYTHDELLGMNVVQWDAGFSTREDLDEVLKGQFRQTSRTIFITRHRRKDGTLIDVEVSGFPLQFNGQQVLFNASRDIGERLAFERALNQANADLSATLQAIPDLLFELSEKGEYLNIWAHDETLLAQQKDLLLGRTVLDMLPPNAAKEVMTALSEAGENGYSHGHVICLELPHGRHWFELSTALKPGADKIHKHFIMISRDITSHKKSEEEIQHLAYYDQLTGLPNRRLFLDRLNQAMAYTHRNQRTGALFFLDLDNFKVLNDTLGHAMGDLLLRQVAQRLMACVREGDTVARLGGDEFVVLLEDLQEPTLETYEQARSIGDKVLLTLGQPYELTNHSLICTPSIGVTFFHGHHIAMEELLKQADLAMYQAKNAGRNALRFFDTQMQATINQRASLETALRIALDHQQFELYYQIQVDEQRNVIGVEGLIRWHHPEKGMISPGQFIPIAEETGLILPLGQWVIEQACAQLAHWQQSKNTRTLTIAINVSAKQFHQKNFVQHIQTALQPYGFDPALLKFELTESLLLEDIEETIETMTQLQEIGVTLSLDDFGTGYSSLQYLKRLPLAQLKIDQSFVRDIATDDSDRAIVRTIIAMAKSLDMDVIAEGLETSEQFHWLKEGGCAHFQGYYFGYPVPLNELIVP